MTHRTLRYLFSHTALLGANTKHCSETVPTLQHNTSCATKSPTVSIERSRTQYRCLYKSPPCLPVTESVYFVVAVRADMAGLSQLSGWSAIWMDQQPLLQVCQKLCYVAVVNCQVQAPISVLSAQKRYYIVPCDDCQFEISTAMSFISSLF